MIQSKNIFIPLFFLISIQQIKAQSITTQDSLEYLVESTSRYLNRDINDSRDFKAILKLDKLYHKIPDSPLKAEAARNLGRYFLSIYSFKVSRTHLLEAIEIYKKHNKWKEVVDTQKELAIVYRLNLQLSELKPLLDASLEICVREKLEESVLIPLMELTLYNSYDTQNYSEAIEWGHKFQDSIAYYDTQIVNDTIFEYRRDLESRIIDIELAKSYNATDTYLDQVLPRLNKAQSFFSSRKDHEKLSRVNEQYLIYYLKVKNFEKASEYLQKSKEHQEQRKKQEQHRIKEMPSYIENSVQLESDLEISHYKNQQLQKLNTLYLASLLTFIILIILGAIYYLHYTRVNKILTTKISNIQAQINADLHDNFGTNLAALGTAKSILSDILSEHDYPDHPLLTKFLTTIDVRLKDLNEDIHDLIWANRKGNNKLHKIISRIQFLTAKFSDLNKFKVQFSYDIDSDFETPSLWNRQLLLIVKEALHNSYKHSKSEFMDIKIVSKNEYFSLTCIDYGEGFDFTTIDRKSGLLNMQKRAESINCELTIKSSDKGTTINLIGYVPRSKSPLIVTAFKKLKTKKTASQ